MGARDLEFMRIGVAYYLGISNTKNDVPFGRCVTACCVWGCWLRLTAVRVSVATHSDFERLIDSTLWKYDDGTGMFVHHQDIPTSGNYDFETFELQGRCLRPDGSVFRFPDTFMTSASSSNGTSRDVASPVFRWCVATWRGVACTRLCVLVSRVGCVCVGRDGTQEHRHECV